MRRTRKCRHAKSGRKQLIKRLLTAAAVISLINDVYDLISHLIHLVEQLITFLHK